MTTTPAALDASAWTSSGCLSVPDLGAPWCDSAAASMNSSQHDADEGTRRRSTTRRYACG